MQYGGFFGYQVSLKQDSHRFRGALGVIGASAGYDYFVSPKWTIGATYTETLRTIYSINLNYYPSSSIKGLQFGFDFAHMLDNQSDGFFNTHGSKDVVWLSVGYTF